MSRLKTEPAGPVKSLEELFAIASVLEQEAAERYADIAVRMRSEGNPALAEVFEHLSADEQGHLDNVVHWSQQTKGQNPDPARIRWPLPETFDDEGAAVANPSLLSAYKVLSMAVRNEERAFAFWTYVAAHAEVAEVRKAAEEMAREELGHVSTLRRERRKAFHAERKSPDAAVSARSVSLAELERQLADRLDAAAKQRPQERMRLAAFAEEARGLARELERMPFAGEAMDVKQVLPDDAEALAELLAERYLEAGDVLRDESALSKVQHLAGRAINRLAWLRADLPHLDSK